MQFPSHVNDCFYLKAVFDARLAGDPEALVLADCRVDWNLPGVRPLGPDIAVFLGVPDDFDRGTLKWPRTRRPAGPGGRGHLARHPEERLRDQEGLLPPGGRPALRDRRRPAGPEGSTGQAPRLPP